MQQAERITVHSLSCLVAGGMQQVGNVQFFEPHVLFPVSWESACERERMHGSSNHTFFILCMGDSAMCSSKNCTFLSPVLWEMVTAAHSLCCMRWYASGLTGTENARFLEPCISCTTDW